MYRIYTRLLDNSSTGKLYVNEDEIIVDKGINEIIYEKEINKLETTNNVDAYYVPVTNTNFQDDTLEVQEQTKNYNIECINNNTEEIIKYHIHDQNKKILSYKKISDAEKQRLEKLDIVKIIGILNVDVKKNDDKIRLDLKRIDKKANYNHYLYIRNGNKKTILLLNDNKIDDVINYTIAIDSKLISKNSVIELLKIPQKGNMVRHIIAFKEKGQKLIKLNNNNPYYNLIIKPQKKVKNVDIIQLVGEQNIHQEINKPVVLHGICTLDYSYIKFTDNLSIDLIPSKHDDKKRDE